MTKKISKLFLFWFWDLWQTVPPKAPHAPISHTEFAIAVQMELGSHGKIASGEVMTILDAVHTVCMRDTERLAANFRKTDSDNAMEILDGISSVLGNRRS